MKKSYLARMGIVEWQLRGDDADKNYFCVKLNDATEKTAGLLLADINHTISLDDQKSLLQKIAKAITPYAHVEIASAASLDTIQKNNYAVVIFLGVKIKEMKFNDRIIESFSLSDLMLHEQHKKQLWAEIKLLRDIFL